ncbi:outer membrane lipoprotein-sorting protein [Candidatus Poribacteria bacterium]|nr:outer membrane lipoprotein-sorting protein [Candidatus Poribacteria bacterium]
MKRFVACIVVFFVFILIEIPLICQEVELKEIVKKAKEQQRKINQEIKDAVFDAKFVYKEFGKKDEIKKDVIGYRHIYKKQDGRQFEEYLRLIVNGKELTGEEFDAEVEEWKDNSRSDDIIMPLSPEGEGAYEFSLLGSEVVKDIPVWVVEFKSKEKKEDYINGKGYISKDTYDIIKAEFEPSKKSRVVKNIDLSMDYKHTQGYWMPAKFKMDLTIKISFIFYLNIKIEDEYSNYKFNTGIVDSVFKDQEE